ncbi:MAG: CHAT domain-containing tetratricopeptide repeat protein [Bacteroidota bacterium]
MLGKVKINIRVLLSFCAFGILLSFGYSATSQSFSLKKEADSLYQQGNYAEAVTSYQRLVQYWQSLSNLDSIHYYQLWQARSNIQQYEYAPARQILESILTQTDTVSENYLLSQMYHELARTYQGSSNIAEALNFSERSITTELSQNQTDTFQLAKYYELRGILQMQSGQYEEAEQGVRYAHRLRKQILEPTDKELGYSANTLYIIMNALGNVAAADSAISETWNILNQNLPEEHPHIAVLANNYSTHLIELGKPQPAKDYLLKAIASNQSGERYFPLIGNYVNLGLLYLNLGENKTAESYYQQAWKIADTLIAYPNHQRAWVLDALGAVYYHQEQYPLADSIFQRSLSEKQEVFDEQNADIAQSIFSLGLVAYGQQQLSKAQTHFRQAENMRRKVLGEFSPKRGDALFELGNIAWEQQDADQALGYWRSARRIFQDGLGLPHDHTLESLIQLAEAFSTLRQPDSVDYYLNLAWASASQYTSPQIVNFDTLTLQQYHPIVLNLINFQLRELLATSLAADELNQAKNVLTAVQDWLPTFQSLFTDASLDQSVADQIQEVYQQGAVIAHRALSQNSPDSVFWKNQLLTCVQSSRGATIQAAFKDREAVKFAGVPDSTVAEGAELKQQLQFALAREQNDNEEDLSAQLSQQRQAILQRWQEYQQQLRQQYPQYYEARFTSQSLSAQQVQQRLQEQKHAVLAYFHLDTALLAVKIDAEGFSSHWLPMELGWQDSLQMYQQLLQNQRDIARQAQLGYFLYQQLWQPLNISAQLPVKILADGPLFYFNFETLLTQPVSSAESETTWHWLIRDYCLYYGHTVTEATSTATQGSILGIAPGFSQDLKTDYLQKLPQDQLPDSVFLGWLRTPWSLEFAERMQEEGWGSSLTAQQATEELLLEKAPQASILHFGTHARLENNRPLYSFLALAPEPTTEQDGYLYTYELYNQPLNAQLAMLTACETGLGRYRRGEGVLSLAHAFRYAGCPSVVYSLWSIDDQQSNTIATKFYEYLREDMTVAQALRAAKLSFMEEAQGSLQSPYYWGGLVLTGQDSTIEISSGGNFRWLVSVGLGMLLLVVGLIFWQKRKNNLAR